MLMRRTQEGIQDMTRQDAKRLLMVTRYADYRVSKIYVNGFKAVRTNEWIKTELYCEVFTDDVAIIDEDNFWNYISIATMVIERYK